MALLDSAMNVIRMHVDQLGVENATLRFQLQEYQKQYTDILTMWYAQTARIQQLEAALAATASATQGYTSQQEPIESVPSVILNPEDTVYDEQNVEENFQTVVGLDAAEQTEEVSTENLNEIHQLPNSSETSYILTTEYKQHMEEVQTGKRVSPTKSYKWSSGQFNPNSHAYKAIITELESRPCTKSELCGTLRMGSFKMGNMLREMKKQMVIKESN